MVTGFAADLSHRRAFLALLDDERLLRVREFRCFHPIPLLSQPGKLSGKLQLQTVQFAGCGDQSRIRRLGPDQGKSFSPTSTVCSLGSGPINQLYAGLAA